MGRNRRTDREYKNTLDVVKENSKTIAENSQIIVENSQIMVENTGRTNEKLDDVRSDIDAIKGSSQMIVENTEHTNELLDDVKSDVTEIGKNTASKLPVVIAIITLLVTISGVSVVGIIDWMKSKTELETVSVVDESEAEFESASEVESGIEFETEAEPKYKIYLYPEYSKFNIGVKIDMTASLNFETDAVSITAHLASGKEDTVELSRKNETEWQKKVVFDEVGVHEIVVAATAPNGEVIENSIEVEVTPVSFDMDIDMDAINQLLGQ